MKVNIYFYTDYIYIYILCLKTNIKHGEQCVSPQFDGKTTHNLWSTRLFRKHVGAVLKTREKQTENFVVSLRLNLKRFSVQRGTDSFNRGQTVRGV